MSHDPDSIDDGVARIQGLIAKHRDRVARAAAKAVRTREPLSRWEEAIIAVHYEMVTMSDRIDSLERTVRLLAKKNFN